MWAIGCKQNDNDSEAMDWGPCSTEVLLEWHKMHLCFTFEAPVSARPDARETVLHLIANTNKEQQTVVLS